MGKLMEEGGVEDQEHHGQIMCQNGATIKQSDKLRKEMYGGPLHPTLIKRTEHDDDDNK